MMIDTMLNFKQQTEHINAEVSAVGAVLFQFMSSVGDSKQKRRVLLSSMARYCSHGIANWAETIAYCTETTAESRKSVYRLSALRVVSAYGAVSEDAVYVIARILSVGIFPLNTEYNSHITQV